VAKGDGSARARARGLPLFVAGQGAGAKPRSSARLFATSQSAPSASARRPRSRTTCSPMRSLHTSAWSHSSRTIATASASCLCGHCQCHRRVALEVQERLRRRQSAARSIP
jgi:hypothetical protein